MNVATICLRRGRRQADGLARRLARGQQGRPRAPLRGVGDQRALTLESAVAAAAMAQDGLLRPRALDLPGPQEALGVLTSRRTSSRARAHRSRCSTRSCPTGPPSSTNLLVDGVLTTFVAACADSTIAPLAQRARKILQEEVSTASMPRRGRRRPCRSGEGERTALLERLEETWAHAGRGGPSAGGATRRRSRRTVGAYQTAHATRAPWLVALLGAEDVGPALEETRRLVGLGPRNEALWGPP